MQIKLPFLSETFYSVGCRFKSLNYGRLNHGQISREGHYIPVDFIERK